MASELRLRHDSDKALLDRLEARAAKEGTKPLDVLRRAASKGLDFMDMTDEREAHARKKL